MNIIIEPGTCAKDINDEWKVFAFKLLEKMEKDLECAINIEIVPTFPYSRSLVLYEMIVKQVSKDRLAQHINFTFSSTNQRINSVYQNIILAFSVPSHKSWHFVIPHFYGYYACEFKSFDIESCMIEIDLDECEWKLYNTFRGVDTNEKFRKAHGIEDI